MQSHVRWSLIFRSVLLMLAMHTARAEKYEELLSSTGGQINGSIATAELLQPPDNETNVSRTPTFTWTKTPGVSRWRIHIDTAQTWVLSEILKKDLVADTIYSLSLSDALKPNTTYYWRVHEVDDFGAVVGTRSFTTTSSLSSSIAISKPNGGDTLGQGELYDIKWTGSTSGTMTFDYSTDNGNIWKQIGSWSGAPPYVWHVPVGVASTKCLVRITKGAESDVSDAVFTIEPTSSSQPSSFDFGCLCKSSQTDSTVTLNIKNTGRTSIRIDSIWVFGTNSHDFVCQSNTKLTVAAGASAILVTLTFSPSAFGLRTATVRVRMQDRDIDIPLQGKWCEKSAVLAASVDPANGLRKYCPGGDLSLVCTASGGVPPYHYSWKTNSMSAIPPGDIVSGDTTSNSITLRLNNAIAGTDLVYRVIVTDCEGSVQTEPSKSVRVLSLPAPQVEGATSVCRNAPTQLYFVSNKQAFDNHLQWSLPDGGGTINSDLTSDTIHVNWTQSGTHRVQLQETNANGTGCDSTTFISVNVSDSLSPVITGLQSTICGIAFADAGAGYSSYEWTQNGSKIGSSRIQPIQQTGTYRVKVSNAQCGGTSSPIAVSAVHPIPTPKLVHGSTMICEGDSAVITVGNLSSFTRPLHWSNGATTDTVHIPSAGPIWLSADSAGCTGQSDTIQISVQPRPHPIATVHSSYIEADITGAQYQWMDQSGSAITAATSQRYSPPQSGSYKVQVTINGCKGTSSLVSFTKSNSGSCLELFDAKAGDWVYTFSEGKPFSLSIVNHGSDPCTISDILSSSPSIFSITPGQLPLTIQAGDTIRNIGMRFKPSSIGVFNATLSVQTSCCQQALATLNGNGIELQKEAVVTSVELIPSSYYVHPGWDSLQLMVTITQLAGKPLTTARRWEAQYGYDARVLSDRSFPEAELNQDRSVPQNAMRRESGIWNPTGSSVVSAHPFTVKYSTIDSTVISIRDDQYGSGFRWKDSIAGEIVYVRTRDTIVHVMSCADPNASKRFVVAQTPAKIFNLHAQPVVHDANITYSTGITEFCDLYLCDMLGNRVQTLFEGFNERGIHSAVLNVGDLNSGMYMLVLNCHQGVDFQTCIIER